MRNAKRSYDEEGDDFGDGDLAGGFVSNRSHGNSARRRVRARQTDRDSRLNRLDVELSRQRQRIAKEQMRRED